MAINFCNLKKEGKNTHALLGAALRQLPAKSLTPSAEYAHKITRPDVFNNSCDTTINTAAALVQPVLSLLHFFKSNTFSNLNPIFRTESRWRTAGTMGVAYGTRSPSSSRRLYRCRTARPDACARTQSWCAFPTCLSFFTHPNSSQLLTYSQDNNTHASVVSASFLMASSTVHHFQS